MKEEELLRKMPELLGGAKDVGGGSVTSTDEEWTIGDLTEK